MKVGVLLSLGGVIAVAGCGSNSTASPPPPTARPTATRVAVHLTPVPTAKARPVATKPAVKATRVRITAVTQPFEEGKADLRARNYTAAAREFQLSIDRHLHVADSYAGLGTASLALQDFRAAFRAYRTAAAIQPRNTFYLYYTSFAALYARDFQTSVAYATRFIHLEPKNASGYHLRFLGFGQLLMHKKQVIDARMVVRLRPRDANSYNDLGIALANDGKPAQAATAFTHAIQLRPANLSYYMNRAQAENLNGQPNLVLRDLEKARSLARDPGTRRTIDEAIANFKKQTQH